jgi:dihydropteroate synthase
MNISEEPAAANATMRQPYLDIRGRCFEWGVRTYVMGIVNLTPDSFSGDGLAGDVQAAVKYALRLVEEGADVLDLGAESTRPGAQPVTADEEMSRLLPVLRELRAHLDMPISVDTYRADVAEAALAVGADMVNDVWGLRADKRMADVVASRGVPVVLMHNRSNPEHVAWRSGVGSYYAGVVYEHLLPDVRRELSASIEVAHSAGIADQQIIIDPGIGFGKTVDQSLALINRLDEVVALGYPVLVGPSRKSFIGHVLDLPPRERLEGTAAAVAAAILRGAHMVRVHDVGPMVRVARMCDAIMRSG